MFIIDYCAVIPPSITNSDPVLKDDSSEARNRIPMAISSAVPSRPIGTRLSLDPKESDVLNKGSVIGVYA